VIAPRAEPRVAPRAEPSIAPRAEPRGWCICIEFLVSASLGEQFASRVYPERSRGQYPERSRGVGVYALDFSSRLRSTNSLSGAEHCTPSEAEGYPIQSRVLHPERSRVLYPERSRGVHIHIRFSSRLRSTNSLSMRGIYCKNNAPHFCEASYHFVINLS
jgi:hypothetical protein